MTDEKWQDLIHELEGKFGIEKKISQEEEIGLDEEGNKATIKREIIEFRGPGGEMRLERTKKPLVLNKKTLYSRRIGGNVRVDYIYSAQEKVATLKAYRREDGEWKEVRYEL